ncbi:MAG: DUF2304 family protein [Solirubrobacterales bacterium]
MHGSRALTPMLALAAALVLAGPASAETIPVTTEDEAGPGSLGDAILRSDPGDTIRIPPGEYLLTNGEVLEANDLRLVGAGTERTTVIPSGGGEALDDPGVVTDRLTEGEPLQPDEAGGPTIETKAQIIALVATVAIFLFVLDLVRRRRLAERYALLWMLAAIALLVLAIWTDGLEVIADAMGIEEPANAIFILAFGVVFGLLLNFSVATSRLSEETKILAQEVARLDHELRAARGEVPAGNGAAAGSLAAGAEQEERERPVGPQSGSQ